MYTRCHYKKTIGVYKWYPLYRSLTLNNWITGSLDFAVRVLSLFTASTEFNIGFVNASFSMLGDVSQCTFALFNTSTPRVFLHSWYDIFTDVACHGVFLCITGIMQSINNCLFSYMLTKKLFPNLYICASETAKVGKKETSKYKYHKFWTETFV